MWDWLAPQLPSSNNGSQATGTISGPVIDSESRAEVEGATVSACPVGSTTFTTATAGAGADGTFTIEVSTGSY